MEHVNPVNYFGFAISGVALLWAVRLVYGPRRGPTDDLMRRILFLAGWTLLLAGTLGAIVGLTGPLSIFSIAGLVVAGLAYFKYMGAERRALLWALAVAAEKGIPLEQAARAFADERSVQIGPRITRLADLMESGFSLPDALLASRNPLAADALLAARIGAETGQMGPALRMCMEHTDHFEEIARNVLAKYFYVVAVLTLGCGVLTFMMLKIIPVWVRMFEEFELALPRLTQTTISVSDFVINAWPITVMVYLALFLLFLFGISYYVRWSRYELPIFNRFWIRCDGSLVLRSLALAVRQGRGLGPTVFMLSKQYPRPSVAQRLAWASSHIDNGVHWCDALRSVGLVRDADVAVLKSAERVDNLAWALEEMADSALRRFAYWLKAAMAIIFPLVVLVIGLTVMFIVIGLFLPLISMIQGLS